MKILIFGDICPTPDFRNLFDSSFNDLCKNFDSIIKSSDYTVCNFECPATSHDKKILKTGPCLKAMLKDILFLQKGGFNLFSLANNHILDYGQRGLIDTLKCLQENNLLYLGAGDNMQKARKPIFLKKNKKVAFLSFAEHEFNVATDNSGGANLFDPYTSLRDIANAKKESDFLIVLYHGGIEYYKFPSPLLQKKCRSMVDFGADLVICQHSHCIGTYENYHSGRIVYGQGNSIFGYRDKNKSWNEGLVLEVSIDDKISINYHLLETTSDGVKLNKDTTRLKEFNSDSEKLSDLQFLNKSFTEFCNKRKALDMPLLFGKPVNYIRLNRILRGRLFKPSKKKIMITHNLIRCDAWNEVIQEQLRSSFDE